MERCSRGRSPVFRDLPTEAHDMTTKHLAKGSQCPVKDPNKLRLYSMLFCPFCERVRMILLLKNVPHEIVNINLKNKPEWLSAVHPEGKVPALDTGDRIITESLDIVEYLDENFPNPPLKSADEQQQEKDKAILDLFSKVLGPFFAAIYNRENKQLDQYMDEMYNLMDPIEDDLAARGTVFFGGEKPGLLDYMMWPWTERSKVPSILFQQPFTFPKDRFARLVQWRLAMKDQPCVKDCIIDAERHALLVAMNIEADKNGTPVDYDNV